MIQLMSGTWFHLEFAKEKLQLVAANFVVVVDVNLFKELLAPCHMLHTHMYSAHPHNPHQRTHTLKLKCTDLAIIISVDLCKEFLDSGEFDGRELV